MRDYVAPQLIKVVVDPKEAFASYSKCCSPTNNDPTPCPVNDQQTIFGEGDMYCTITSSYCG